MNEFHEIWDEDMEYEYIDPPPINYTSPKLPFGIEERLDSYDKPTAGIFGCLAAFVLLAGPVFLFMWWLLK